MAALSFFADENIQEEIVEWLRQKGFDVSGIKQQRIFGLSDEKTIEKAFK